MTDKIKSEDFIKAFGSGVGAKAENIPIIVIDCKYYLPCGRCDKTGGFCSMDITNPKEYLANPNLYIPVNNNGIEPK